jgi:hypothetical protein
MTVKDWLSYSPETGEFIWIKKGKGKNVLGGRAGWYDRDGYVCITVQGAKYKAGRLAWWFMTGNQPTGAVDHINGVRHDNRLDNLRIVSPHESSANRAMQENNTLRVKNVTFSKGAYQVRVSFNKKSHYFGRFKSLDEAARVAATAGKTIQGDFYRGS